ncbi:hypothetical protein NS206_00495 [Microbacterium testaceum]|uniref:hypothetical protein n=1 Tax=Microbacterium testaceum TaxID=2033 RepID=UPI0007342906|nr:hypothetical protein [Microbacterium testaceum]KTS70379.1 hypothetical protein NS206_00495 [Microbacterium testaceum]
MTMDFKFNPDFARQMHRQLRKLQAAVEKVSSEYSGKEMQTVRRALRLQWAAVGNGAKISDPELTNVATLISQGKRVWLGDDGILMAED